jgi:hypothetical protein
MGGDTKLTRVALIAGKDVSMLIIRLLGARAVLDGARAVSAPDPHEHLPCAVC